MRGIPNENRGGTTAAPIRTILELANRTRPRRGYFNTVILRLDVCPDAVFKR